jgi:hypothetical protein
MSYESNLLLGGFMNTKLFARGLALFCLSALVVACGKGSTKTWNIDPNAVSDPGCLNMERLLGAMQGFPDETLGHRYTYDMSVKSDGASRSEALVLMARGNFIFEDRPVRQLFDFNAAKQNGCSDLTMIDGEGNQEKFTVKEGGKAAITFANEDKTYKVTMLDSTSMRVYSDLPTTDPCNNMITARIQKTDILRWGGPDVTTQTDEKVSPQMLSMVARSTDNVPEGIRSVMNSNSDEVTVRSSDLKQLRDSEVRNDVMACFAPNGGPSVPNPDIPNQDPNPTPAPAPASVHASGS